jgi:NADPH:quinone reductase-like Zn-dependent oxidoreductase
MSLACTLHGPLQLRIEPQPPAEPGPGEVLVRLGAGGICGSDLHCYQHGRAGAFDPRAVRADQPLAAAFDLDLDLDLALDRSRSTKVQLVPG